MVSFLDHPERIDDTSCLDELFTEWSVPGDETDEVTLEPYSSETFLLSTVVPAGWEEQVEGVFVRGVSALDQTLLLIQGAAGVTADQFLEIYAEQFALEVMPEPVGQREANGLTWTMYSITLQGMQAELAVVETDGASYTLMLMSEPDEHDALYDAVFVPALDAFVPSE